MKTVTMALAGLLAASAASAQAQGNDDSMKGMAGMDHSQMDHGQVDHGDTSMPGMDHDAMSHGTDPATGDPMGMP